MKKQAGERRIAVMAELTGGWQRHLDIFNGILRYSREREGWHCIIDEFVPQTLAAQRGKRLPYDGVIARATAKLARAVDAAGIPAVNVWMYSPAKELPLIAVDNKVCGELSFEHLIERGFRRFAWLPLRMLRGNAIQVEVIRDLCRKHDFEFETLPFGRDYCASPDKWTATIARIGEWLENVTRPIAVVVSEVFLARMLMQCCDDRGIRVPQDMAIVTERGEKSLVENMAPQLTTIDTDYEQIGYAAAKMLDGLMDGMPAPDEPVLIPPSRIIARESTDYFAVEDETVAAALRYISDSIARPIGVEEIAEAVAVSPRTLQRRFQEHLGRPVGDELRRLRITMAQRLLVDPDRSIKEIAHRTGFVDTRGMCRSFQKELGLSPSRYRREHQVRHT